MENAIEVTDAIVPSEMEDRVIRWDKGGGACFAWRTRSTSSTWCEREGLNDQGATETTTTVRHEREQGDEKKVEREDVDRREGEEETGG